MQVLVPSCTINMLAKNYKIVASNYAKLNKVSILSRCAVGANLHLSEYGACKSNAEQFPSEMVVSLYLERNMSSVVVRSYVLLDGGPWGKTPNAILVAIKLQHTHTHG